MSHALLPAFRRHLTRHPDPDSLRLRPRVPVTVGYCQPRGSRGSTLILVAHSGSPTGPTDTAPGIYCRKALAADLTDRARPPGKAATRAPWPEPRPPPTLLDGVETPGRLAALQASPTRRTAATPPRAPLPKPHIQHPSQLPTTVHLFRHRFYPAHHCCAVMGLPCVAVRQSLSWRSPPEPRNQSGGLQMLGPLTLAMEVGGGDQCRQEVTYANICHLCVG